MPESLEEAVAGMGSVGAWGCACGCASSSFAYELSPARTSGVPQKRRSSTRTSTGDGHKEKHKNKRSSGSFTSSRRLRLPPNVSALVLYNVIALQNSGEIAESERELDSALKQLPKTADPRLGISGALLFLWRSRTRKLLGRASEEVVRDLKSAVAHVEELEATPNQSPSSTPAATPASIGATVTIGAAVPSSGLPPLVTGVPSAGGTAEGESDVVVRASAPDRRTLEVKSRPLRPLAHD